MPLPRFVLPALLFVSATALGADWPGWRGPGGMGRTDDKSLPLTWNVKTGENVRWKFELPIPAGGADQNQSSPVVCAGRVFITISYWDGKPDPKRHPEHRVVCLRADDGKLLWNEKVEPGPWLFADLRGGYTAPTPTADVDRVYVVFGSSVIAALDHSGKAVWRKEIRPFKFDVALAASPVLFGDTVILQCDELDRQSRLIAFDKKTGEVAWEAPRPTVGFVALEDDGGRDRRRQATTTGCGEQRGAGRRSGEREGAVDVRGEG